MTLRTRYREVRRRVQLPRAQVWRWLPSHGRHRELSGAGGAEEVAQQLRLQDEDTALVGALELFASFCAITFVK